MISYSPVLCPLVCRTQRMGSCRRERHLLKIGWSRKHIILAFVWINIDISWNSFCDMGYPTTVCMSALRGAGGWGQAPAPCDPVQRKGQWTREVQLFIKETSRKSSRQLLSFVWREFLNGRDKLGIIMRLISSYLAKISTIFQILYLKRRTHPGWGERGLCLLSYTRCYLVRGPDW